MIMGMWEKRFQGRGNCSCRLTRGLCIFSNYTHLIKHNPLFTNIHTHKYKVHTQHTSLVSTLEHHMLKYCLNCFKCIVLLSIWDVENFRVYFTFQFIPNTFLKWFGKGFSSLHCLCPTQKMPYVHLPLRGHFFLKFLLNTLSWICLFC